MKKVTTATLLEMKQRGEKIAVLTAYDALFGRIEDEAGIDVILVGDSAAMVVAGEETTLKASMGQMLYHVSCVKRSVKRCLLVADMPFMTFQLTPEEALRNAGRFLAEAGAEAVKLEGGKPVVEIVRRLVDVGVPVMGHLGLTPQSIHKFGSWAVRGRTDDEADKMLKDAEALAEAGAFSIVLEKIPGHLAKRISESIPIPTIGIGSGPHCDGQVLVNYDMLGLYEELHLKFVRQYRKLATEVRGAVQEYIRDVKNGSFPSAEESYDLNETPDDHKPLYTGSQTNR